MTGPREPAAAPPLDATLAVDPAVLAGALRSIPDGDNALLRLADGRRTVKDLVAMSGLEAPRALSALERLLGAGVLRVVPPGNPAVPEARPGTEPADWFADPGSPSPDGPPSGRGGQARPVRRGRARTFGLVAAIALGAVLLGWALWAALSVTGPVPGR